MRYVRLDFIYFFCYEGSYFVEVSPFSSEKESSVVSSAGTDTIVVQVLLNYDGPCSHMNRVYGTRAEPREN